ncbi:MAG: glycosyltransferase, partial [Flavobacteriaceae bacterium]|nr:glycosyltransferase [Flavobacteriaceae bacterium]
SLPNKVFDYIQCQTPILTSNRKVIAQLVEENNIGIVTKTHDPKELAKIVKTILSNSEILQLWNENLIKAANIYTWVNEEKKLKEIYSNLK